MRTRGEGSSAGVPPRARERPRIAHMLAAVARQAPTGAAWTYEPKYDGIRVLAIVEPAPARAVPRVWLLTRNDNDKSAQFPAIASALLALANGRRHAMILDGEIVALAPDGAPARFEAIQPFIHARRRQAAEHEAAFVAFDCLADGNAPLHDGTSACTALSGEPWQVRRAHLEDVMRHAIKRRGTLRLSATSGDLGALLADARRERWEGIMAKDRTAPYACGVRSAAWQKVKLEQRQEFVVGGWTDPRGGRPHMGALLVGTYAADGSLTFAGPVGTGFTHEQLAEFHEMLRPLARDTSPFASTPPIEGAHWVRPELVVEVRFNEWTEAGRLRQPSFVGLRDDKAATQVVREHVRHRSTRARGAASEPARPRPVREASGDVVAWPIAHERLCAELEAMEREAPDASAAVMVDGRTLRVTHLARVVIGATRRGKGQAPTPAVTKGDLMRYYLRMAPVLLPAIADRPLVLRRYTGDLGDDGLPTGGFYQQHARGATPAGVRTMRVAGDPEPRFVGGDLVTLLHLVQLGAISVDPWHSRVQSLEEPDYTILDLDPMPDAPFTHVVAVAEEVHATLERLGLHAIPKTSGATGLHVMVPLPPGTPALTARLLAELVATRVAQRLPTIATIARSVRARATTAVYVDYLQNITGKSVASVYSARATPGAGVSMPLDWHEVTRELTPRAFTIRTAPRRVKQQGDRWAAGMRVGNSLDALLEATVRLRGARGTK